MTRKTLITLFAIASILSFEAGFAAAEAPAVLGLKDQARVVDSWLKVRLDTVLPELMRREKFDMWLVVCEEYNEDPVYLTLVPFEDL
ncbi:MAG: Xaa-Pro aminopeptidase, partial [Candidatus Aminicenantes bacterium]|nr:Xaa-Pro aminopeptidase [Candidatus Aminicenantes bacterium]